MVPPPSILYFHPPVGQAFPLQLNANPKNILYNIKMFSKITKEDIHLFKTNCNSYNDCIKFYGIIPLATSKQLKYCIRIFSNSRNIRSKRKAKLRSVLFSIGRNDLFKANFPKSNLTTIRKKNHYAFQKIRAVVLERDKYICRVCGSTRSLECHHIEPVKTNPGKILDQNNLITLCRRCHIAIHKK